VRNMPLIYDFLEVNILLLIYKVIRNIYRDEKVSLIFFIHLLSEYYNVNISIKDVNNVSLLKILNSFIRVRKYNNILRKTFNKYLAENADEDALLLFVNRVLKTLLEKYEDTLTMLLAVSFLFYIPLILPAIIFNIPFFTKIIYLTFIGLAIMLTIVVLSKRIL